MKLIKPILKFGAKLGNSIFCKVSLNRNKSKAYSKVGKQIAKAKKTGKYVDGSLAYKKQLKELNESTKKRTELVDDFIDFI